MSRVTPGSQVNTAIFQAQSITSRLANLQGQASSGLRFTRPSDNPLDTSRISRLDRTISLLENQQRSITAATDRLNSGVSHLIEINSLVTRARQIALQAPQSNSIGESESLAREVDSLIDRLLTLSNGQQNGDFLFSGDSFNTPPFQIIQNESLAISQIQYNGSQNSAVSFISQSISVTTAFPGSQVFGQNARQPSLYFGNTGAAAGIGIDTETGRVNLQVIHESTFYDIGAGILPGSSSAQGDTIIGDPGTHELFLNDTSGDGSSGTVSLNGGAPVNFTSADIDLEVPGPQGERVFIDVSSVTAGFSGPVTLRAEGSLSTDGGATTFPIDFSSNQVVTNSITGGVLNVDTREILSAGVEPVELPGSADLFTTLFELRDDLQNNRGLDRATLNESFDRRVGELENLSQQILDFVGTKSVSLEDLDLLSFRNDQQQLESRTQLSGLESADISAVVIELQELQTTLQFNFAALSVVQSSNILDFLG